MSGLKSLLGYLIIKHY